jgi:hypothetical protein
MQSYGSDKPFHAAASQPGIVMEVRVKDGVR